MLKKLLTFSGLSLKEIVHKKILFASALLTLAYLTLFGIGLHYLAASDSDGFINRTLALSLFTMALYLAQIITSLMAVLLSVGAIAGELENGTAYALLSRPVSRRLVLLGKYLGYCFFLAIFSALFFLGIWVLVWWQTGISLTGVGEAVGLFILQPLVLLSLCFLASSTLSVMSAGTTVFLVYGVSLVGGMVEQIGAIMSQFEGHTIPALRTIGIITSLILPVDAIYRRAAYSLMQSSGDLMTSMSVMGPFGSLSIPSIWMIVYAVLYLLGTLWLAARVFQGKDL